MDLKFLILVRCLSLVAVMWETPINLIRIKWFYVVKNLENESEYRETVVLAVLLSTDDAT